MKSIFYNIWASFCLFSFLSNRAFREKKKSCFALAKVARGRYFQSTANLEVGAEPTSQLVGKVTQTRDTQPGHGHCGGESPGDSTALSLETVTPGMKQVKELRQETQQGMG